jgi:hypothetical protein
MNEMPLKPSRAPDPRRTRPTDDTGRSASRPSTHPHRRHEAAPPQWRRRNTSACNGIGPIRRIQTPWPATTSSGIASRQKPGCIAAGSRCHSDEAGLSECGHEIAFNEFKTFPCNRGARNQNKIHRPGEFKLMQPERFAQETFHAAANHRSTDFRPAYHAQPSC